MQSPEARESTTHGSTGHETAVKAGLPIATLCQAANRQLPPVWLDLRAMESDRSPQIIEAERFENSVIITFGNGETAIYSAALLYKMFADAERVENCDREES